MLNMRNFPWFVYQCDRVPLGHIYPHTDFRYVSPSWDRSPGGTENNFPPHHPPSSGLTPKGISLIHHFSLWDSDVLRNSLSHIWTDICGCADGNHSWASGVYLKQKSVVQTHMMALEQFLLTKTLGFKYKLEAVSQFCV